MRYLYNLLFYTLLPFILLRLLWRSRLFPNYRQRVTERLGFLKTPTLSKSIWIHAVSFGEARVATPLIIALQEKYPDLPLVVTSMTATGSAQITNVCGNKVLHYYVPYDYPAAIKRFLKNAKPQLLIIMETELWPNILYYCKKEHIPIVIANARLAERSAKGYQRLSFLFRPLLQQLTVLAQAPIDAERFIKIGVLDEKVHIIGNIKFDVTPPQNLLQQGKKLRGQLGANRFVWIAASTHKNEEEIILKAFSQIRQNIPNALLILVPRHPERFDEVAKLCEQHNYKIARRSTIVRAQHAAPLHSIAIYLGDTMGELWLLYAAADVAFVGGSLIPQGGHNILEPAALGLPIITGPHIFNFQQIVTYFQEQQALTIVNNAEQLAKAVVLFHQNNELAKEQGERGLQVVKQNQGALQKTLQWLDQAIRRVD